MSVVQRQDVFCMYADLFSSYHYHLKGPSLRPPNESRSQDLTQSIFLHLTPRLMRSSPPVLHAGSGDLTPVCHCFYNERKHLQNQICQLRPLTAFSPHSAPHPLRGAPHQWN